MEIDGARQAADAHDTDDQPAGAADASGAAPAQTTESDASYYTEDMPVAAYQPIETNVLQPLEHAGEDGDTEAPSEQQREGPAHGAAGWRAPQLSSRQRRRARARAQAAVPLQPADSSEREMMM